MASLKEIRSKVASIKSTQKITKAMQLVAASKMRRAQERMARGKPYAQKIRQVIAHLSQATPEYKHQYMVERPVKRVGFIVVSSDRGLVRRPQHQPVQENGTVCTRVSRAGCGSRVLPDRQ
jgi:F-type H+-transporting ATPase subunit gamma